MFFSSQVIHGHGLGRKISYPTINLIIPKNFTLPFGVYSARVDVENNSYLGAMFYGKKKNEAQRNPPKPKCTIYPRLSSGQTQPNNHDLLAKAEEIALEIHLLNFSGNLYSQKVKVKVGKKISKVKKITNLEELKKKIHKDIEKIKKVISFKL